MKRFVHGIVFSAAAALTFMQAPASWATATTFAFSGVCSDCDGSAKAELVLKNYTLGDTLDTSNLVSFTYGGTNLLSPFTITPSQDPYFYGVINGPLPAGEDVIIFSSAGFFDSAADGHWCAGPICGGDQGYGGQWSLANSVPETSTWALIFLGLVGASYLGHRRSAVAAQA